MLRRSGRKRGPSILIGKLHSSRRGEREGREGGESGDRGKRERERS